MPDIQSTLRELPAVDRLLKEPVLETVMTILPRRLVLLAVQDTISGYRHRIIDRADQQGSLENIDLSPAAIAVEAAALAKKRGGSRLKPLINATGVVIHTNLGRAPLAQKAVDALARIAFGYNNLEMDLESGERGFRMAHVEELICELSGAESALVVNNNAAAVFLALNTLAAGRQVVVSRGQLVEIGGSFRIPEIIAASGAVLVEVGATNKTHLRDYEAAVAENTAAFLKVHTSNYQMVGFTAEVTTAELAQLAHRHNLPLVDDLGSGVFIDLQKYNLPAEPRVQDSIVAGADLVTFSGDKMLGGPQAGIIVGRKDLISYMRSNQLSRALRVDKFTLAALEETLKLYLDEEKAVSEIPVWRMLTADKDVLKERAERLAAALDAVFGAGSASVITGISRVGGGALPMAELPTSLVSLKMPSGLPGPSEMAARLRMGETPVIVRLQQDSLLFDPRTIREDEESHLLAAVKAAAEVGK